MISLYYMYGVYSVDMNMGFFMLFYLILTLLCFFPFAVGDLNHLISATMSGVTCCLLFPAGTA